MPEKNFGSQDIEADRQSLFGWLNDQLNDYMEVFSLPKERWTGKKILDVGSTDRRVAAACAVARLDTEVYSLDPAYDPLKEGYAAEEMLHGVVEKLPEAIRTVIDQRTVSTTAEETGFEDDVFDVAIVRSVNYESIEQLTQRIRELLRVAKEVRFYPIDEINQLHYKGAITAVQKVTPLDVQYTLTVDCHLRTESGIRHVQESVVALRKK